MKDFIYFFIEQSDLDPSHVVGVTKEGSKYLHGITVHSSLSSRKSGKYFKIRKDFISDNIENYEFTKNLQVEDF